MNTNKIRPLNDRAIFRRVEEHETAHAGVVIPDTAGARPPLASPRSDVLATSAQGGSQ